jgi:uncharacterized membrane protein YeaQ/YmgE (transglycosylase-associated protein family)
MLLLALTAHAGPLGDGLRNVSSTQASAGPRASRQRLWANGLVLTVVGGVVIISAESQTRRDPDSFCGTAFFTDCSISDPNRTLTGLGAAMVGAGVVMMILGRSKATPQIVATPRKVAIQHTVTF